MNFITHLIHDDMFLAVVSYLSIGLIFLAYFYFREKKWEADLSKYEIKPMFPSEASGPAYQPGTLSFNRSSDKIVAVVGLNEEMQVAQAARAEHETAMAVVEVIAITNKPVISTNQPVISATILPFRPPRRNPSASSQHQHL